MKKVRAAKLKMQVGKVRKNRERACAVFGDMIYSQREAVQLPTDMEASVAAIANCDREIAALDKEIASLEGD